MKLAVFSDIHSNSIALEACVEFIKKETIDGILFLGDNISDFPNPQKTLSIIKKLEEQYRTWHVRGNREEYFIHHADGADDEWEYSSYKGSLLYTYEHLTREDINRFRQYPLTRRIEIPGLAPITITHGSPDSPRELLYPEAENTKHFLDTITTDYLIGGHSHKQFSYSYHHRMMLNPGSIGVAIGKRAAADFAILEWEDGKWNSHFFHIPYDLDKVKEMFEKSSLMDKAYVWPKCILKSLEMGVNMGPICAKKAYDMARADGVIAVGENKKVPEGYWRKAAKELNIIEP